MAKWNVAEIPNPSDRTVVITGTGGLGYEDALVLAQAGAEVIIAGRNPEKGAEAVNKIRAIDGKANVIFEVMDLANLASVAAFGARMQVQQERVDLLINNAAVMAPPTRKFTSDGFELQFGTNYLGHFALTAHLLPLLLKGRNPRVVTVASIAANDGKIQFDDLQSEQNYRPMGAYGQSKLANLMFAFELQRRSDAAGWGILSIAAHPGISSTELIPNGAGPNSFGGVMRRVFGSVLFQSPAQGALPTLFAATSAEAKGGAYYGPDGFRETRGYPTSAKVPPQAEDAAVAARLWSESEKLTGVTFSQFAVPEVAAV